MTTRTPGSRLPTGDAPLKPSDAGAQLRDLRANPMVNGALIRDQKTDGTTNVCFFRHGFGRSFVATSPAGQDHEGSPLIFLTPAKVQALGKDPAKYFAVKPPAAEVITFSVWVY